MSLVGQLLPSEGVKLLLMKHVLRGLCLIAPLFASSLAMAWEYHGLVTSGGFPVPGATITVTQGAKTFVTVTDMQGAYFLPNLASGAATIQIQMTGFSTIEQAVRVVPGAAADKWELKLLSVSQIQSILEPGLTADLFAAPMPAEAHTSATQDIQPPQLSQETDQQGLDGLLINGSVNNAATSQVSLRPRFGNTAIGKSLYSFSLNGRFGDSALNAKSYSITGVDTPKPQTSEITGGFALEGPLQIPHLLPRGPNLFVEYQRTSNEAAVTTPALVPDISERSGVFAEGTSPQLYNPTTGQPYPNSAIQINPQAQALLNLYPLPNFVGNSRYNYQIPLTADIHRDDVSSNVSKRLGFRDQLTGTFAALSERASNSNTFGFVDTTRELGMSGSINWTHTLNEHLFFNAKYDFSRQSDRIIPYWENRRNISGQAGIAGNDQDPTNWGPPTLVFAGGLASLTDAQSSFTRNITNSISSAVAWSHQSHNFRGGVDFRRRQFNYLSQANPRGTFTFTGAATAGGGSSGGSDVADFLLGVPDASTVNFGNTDKYLRQSVFDVYLKDDWKVSSQLTVNAGVRWEYGTPVTELKGRLVNLDITPGFSAIAPVVAINPKGPLTGETYPHSLVRPDKNGAEPRIGASWRPIPASSLLMSAGYGIDYDTSVYEGIAIQMAQQAPLAKSLTVQNSALCPLTLASGFNLCPDTTPQVFGIDPNFRVGYVQTWDLNVQRDLPGSLQIIGTYLGIKGTHGVQEFLPNTNPAGSVNPCQTCPSGFEYLTSTGNSTRESGQIQLRRRLHSGFTASVLYVFSKSIDDDSALGGQGAATRTSTTIAQDWRNLRAERGLSTFDQRHLVKLQIQYTTGMGIGGGTLLTGWAGKFYKEWTIRSQLDAGSGLAQTPLVSSTIIAGHSDFVRPDLTGAPLYRGPSGLFLNPAAFAAPPPGQWGNARRGSITGPSQFSLDTSITRTFRLNSRFNLDTQIAAINILNHVTFSGWITNINSTQFGLPAEANPMRRVQTALRLRF